MNVSRNVSLLLRFGVNSLYTTFIVLFSCLMSKHHLLTKLVQAWRVSIAYYEFIDP